MAARQTTTTTADLADEEVSSQDAVPSLMLPAILLTVLCFSPFGVLALLSNRQIRVQLAHGDYPAAVAAAQLTRRRLQLGFVVAVLCAVGVIVAQIVAAL